jgi:ATP-dependent DNA ligase
MPISGFSVDPSTMSSTFDFCLPSPAQHVPAGPDWLHEIKYDGYRLRLERDGDCVRLITRGGYDWTKRNPRIVESALKNRIKQFVVDGEAVVLSVDGVADFNALHSRKSSSSSARMFEGIDLHFMVMLLSSAVMVPIFSQTRATSS